MQCLALCTPSCPGCMGGRDGLGRPRPAASVNSERRARAAWRRRNLSNGGPKGVYATTILQSLSLSIHRGNVVQRGKKIQDARPHGRAPMGESTSIFLTHAPHTLIPPTHLYPMAATTSPEPMMEPCSSRMVYCRA
jgi:hypothetical protein